MTFLLSLTIVNSWLDKLERDQLGVKKGVTIEGVQVERLLPEELREVIEEMAIQEQKLPVEPTIDKQTGAIIPEKSGIIINVEENVSQILAVAEGNEVKLKRVNVQSRYKKESLEEARHCLGSYATGFHGSGERYKNISVACYSINHTVLWPGDVFSFNETTGPRTPERGYLPAPVIMGGSFGMDYGGGVCQVSSTLYNAVLNADLPILERHAHSKPIRYVPPGQDAAVSYGDQDLRFRNNRTGPLIIKASVYRGRIAAEIWGGK